MICFTRSLNLKITFLVLVGQLSVQMKTQAAEYFWDAAPYTDGNQNGKGYWSSLEEDFYWTPTASSSGSVNQAWVNAADSLARLGASTGYTNSGIGGTITLNENITLGELQVGTQAGAYKITSGGSPYKLQFQGTSPTIRVDSTQALTIEAGVSSSSSLVKTGTGRVIFNAASGENTFTGLNIHEGAVQLGAVNTLATSSNIILGNNSTAGTLDVRTNQTVSSLAFQSRNISAVNQVNIASGTTLTVSSGMVAGILDGTSSGANTQAVISGQGNLVVAGNFVVSHGAKSSGAVDNSSLNMSGLASFTSSGSRFEIGRTVNAAGVFQSTGNTSSALTLANSNNITATSMVVGSNIQSTSNNVLNLGAQNNITANQIVVGAGRASGTIQFAAGLINPTLTLNSSGSILLGDSMNVGATSGTGGSSHPTGTIDLTRGIIDFTAANLIIGIGGTDNSGFNGGAYGRGIGHFTFGGSTSKVTIDSLTIGNARNSNLVAANTADPYVTSVGSFTMNGGNLTVNTFMALGVSDDGVTGNQQNITSTFTLTKGHAEINSNIFLGQHTSTGTGIINATMNLNGGSMSVHQGITRQSSNSIGTVNLNGTWLDMMGSNIGDAANPVTFLLQAGKLSNLGQFNDGADLTKTSANRLILSGTNTFTGRLIVNEGVVLVTSASALQNTSGIVVRNNGKFHFNDAAGGTYTVPVSTGVAIRLENGSSIGAQLGSSTGSIVVQPGATVETEAGAAIKVDVHAGTSAPPASSILVSAAGGGITANGATYSVGTVYNATNFLVTGLNVTNNQIAVNTVAEAELPNAYWKGGFSGGANVWSASNGSTLGNWARNADGTGDTGLVPGLTTNVFFPTSATSLPTSTILGAHMRFATLTVDTAAALTLNDLEYSLTLGGNSALTVNAGAGAVTLATNLHLLSAIPTIHVNNTHGLTLEGTLTAGSATTITKTGAGTLYLNQSTTTHNAKLYINGGTVALGDEAALGSAPAAPTADQLRLDNGTLRATSSFRINDTNRGITIGTNGGTFEVDTNLTLGIDRVITGNGRLTKSGAGRLEITQKTTHTGPTTIRGGTLAVSGNNNTLSTASLTFEASSATLDLGSTTQDFSALNITRVAGGMNLEVKGAGGTMNVTNTTSATQWITDDQTAPLNLDMSGLSNFNFNGTGQALRIGIATIGSHSATGTHQVVTTRLAQTNNITTGNLLIADQVGSSGGGLTTVLLGSTNTINANLITLAGSRSSGAIRFADDLVNPTLRLRATNGTAPVTSWTMGTLNNFENTTWSSTADFTGGNLDAAVTTLSLGHVDNRSGTLNATFTMDRGTLTVTNMNVGSAAGSTTGSQYVRTVNSVFNLIGTGTVDVTNLTLASNQSATNTGVSTANATINIYDGEFNVGSGGVNMGNAAISGHVSNGIMNLYGGVTSVNGDITRGAGSGTTTATINLSGGTLDLNGKNIGTAAQTINNLILNKGHLRNVAQINGGGAITKSGGVGDVVRLEGNNTYTGATNISGGVFLVDGTHTGAGSYTAQAGTTLGGDGSITLAANATVSLLGNSTLMAGDGIDAAQSLSITTSGANGKTTLASTSTVLASIWEDTGTGGTDHSASVTSADLLTIFGQLELNGARLVVLDPLNLSLAFSEGDSWRLFDFSSVTTVDFGTATNRFGTFELPDLATGLVWDTSQVYTSGIIYVSTPEPGRAMLVLIGIAVCTLRRKRN